MPQTEMWQWADRHPVLRDKIGRMLGRLAAIPVGSSWPLDVCAMFEGQPCGEPSPDNSGLCVAHKAEFEDVAGHVTALLRDDTPLPW